MHARCITVYCTFHISKLISKGVCIFTGFNNFCFTCFCIGKLLPGMNVDGVITLAQADDVLTIPVDARMRGNQVYVQDSSVTEAQGRYLRDLRRCRWKPA